MVDKDGDGPSLELPSLGFGRKRGKKSRGARGDAPVAPETTPETTPEPTPTPEPVPVAQPTPIPDREPVTEPEPVAAPEPVAGPEPVAEPEPVTEPVSAHVNDPEPSTTRMPATSPPAPAAPPLSADEVRDSPTRTEDPPVGGERTKERKPKRAFALPALDGMAAALVTGAVAGLLMVGLTGAGFRLCEVIQGAPSCGDPGFLLLLAIVIVVILVGKALLAAWSLPDPGSTSFLAVGLLSVVALLFLVDVLFNWWMIILIPVLGMLCFALSHWVTTAFVETDD